MLRLRLKTLMALTVASLLILGPNVGKAEILEQFSFEGWEVIALAEDDGSFDTCLMISRHDNGITLAFAIDQSTLSLLLINPSWQLSEREIYRATLRVDSSWQRQRGVVVPVETTLMMPLGRDDETRHWLKHGSSLSVDVHGRHFEFELKGMMLALTNLEHCPERWRDAGNPKPPPGEFDQPPAAPSGGSAVNPFAPDAAD